MNDQEGTWRLAIRGKKWHQQIASFDEGEVLTVCSRRMSVCVGISRRLADLDPATVCSHCRRNGSKE